MAESESDVRVTNLDVQRRETERLMRKRLICNDIWFLIHSEWFKSFSRYIGLDKEIGEYENEHPGPIDNGPLYKDDDPSDIREHLIEEADYVLVPEELWSLLCTWYGTVADQKPIARRVIEYGEVIKNAKIEVYLLPLRLVKDYDMDNVYTIKFSKADAIAFIAERMRKIFKIPDDVNLKLVGSFTPNSHEQPLSPLKTIEEEGLYVDQVIVGECCRPDGSYIKPSKNNVSSTSSGNSVSRGNSFNVSNRSNSSSSMSRSTRFNSAYSSNEMRSGSVTPGLCGLSNMGNTCFMNSVIQCLSNCPPLMKHFVEDTYLKDLNTVNPIGMRGEIATAFGELMKFMWSGKCPAAVPKQFKLQVGKFAPQFSGYQQQDSQELLTFLLDGLHEDLNKIKQKPYIALRDSDGRPDEVVAEEAWEIYKKRNDSVIVDYFHGLLKSTVVCPDCEKVSVTFDPFCHLSLPLPIKRERHIEVKFFPSDVSKTPQIISAMVPKKGHINDLLCAVNHQCGVSPDELVVAEIIKHHFHKFYSNNDALENIDLKDDIAVYEIPRTESHVPVPVVLWEVNARQTFNFSQLFGHPLILMLPRENCTYDHIYRGVLAKLSHCLVTPPHEKCRCCKEGSTASLHCKCASPDNLALLFPEDLFTIHVVNALTTSVAYKLHMDENPIGMPISDVLGRQYLAVQWTTENRKQFFKPNVPIFQGSDIRQKRSYRVHLTDCLELFTMCEKLGADDAWYCPDCKQHQRATKKFDLWKLPQILIIHLKRFSYSRFRRDKLDTFVDFTLNDLDMSNYIINDKHPPAKYNLIGVCNHYGGMGGGHYTAFCLNKIDKQWYNFDDHNVIGIPSEQVVTNAGYVLFYMRND